MSEVLTALQQHTKSVTDLLGGLKKRIDDETSLREELERKVNKGRLGNGTPDRVNDATLFERSLKSWYPERARGVDYAEYAEAFSVYLRGGKEMLSHEQVKAMSVGSDPDGGYVVISEFHREIVRVEQQASAIRSVARAVPIGTGSLEIPASLTSPATGWVGETQARAVTASGALGKVIITPGEVYAMPEASQRILDDSEFNVEAFIGELIGEAFGIEEDAKFIAGDGVIGPRGFTTYSTATTTDAAGTRPFGTIQHIGTGVSGNWPATDTLIYDLLVNVVAALRPGYRKGAAWVMGTEAIARLQKLKSATDLVPLWQQSLIAGAPSMLLGYPVVEAPQMPAIAANSLSVAFGNWQRAYWIVDRLGVRTLRDPYTNKPFVRFYSTKRVGGGLVDSSAIKLIKFI